MHYETKALPESIRAALARLECGQELLECKTAESFTLYSPGGTGQYGVCAIVDVATGATTTHRGAWGGPNPFSGGNGPVDVSKDRHPLPPGVVVLKGNGGHRPWVRMLAHQHTRDTMLPTMASAPRLTSEQAIALDALCTFNSRGRRDWFRRHGWGSARIDSVLSELASAGLVKRSRNGATKVTSAGRNARDLSDIRAPY